METRIVVSSDGEFECPDDAFADKLARGGHQRPDVAFMRAVIAPGDLVIDAGAYVGTVVVPLARSVAPQGRVVAIEGSSEHAALLKANLDRNGVSDQVTVVNHVLGAPEMRWSERRLDLSAATTWFEPSTDSGGVGATSLDEVLAVHASGERVRLIKIDVEGLELEVLRGATRALAGSSPVLVIEVARSQLARYATTPAELDTFLRSKGYRLYLNLVRRNSPIDEYKLGRILRLRWLGPALVDVYAIHVADTARPRRSRVVRTTCGLARLSFRVRLQRRRGTG